MTAKLKHKRKKTYTDKEIEQFCQSVEDLLININDRSTAKKGKKAKGMKENLSFREDSWPSSRN